MTTTTTPTQRVSLMSLSGRPTPHGHLRDHASRPLVQAGIRHSRRRRSRSSDATVDIPGRARSVDWSSASCRCASSSSSNYVINEMLDAPYDLFHPTKRQPPGAVGSGQHPAGVREWIALTVVGIGLGFVVNAPLGYTMIALWVMGCIYNIPPIRSKDQPYLDVLSESINNPLRMLAGWYITGTPTPDLAARQLLDGRLLLHGDQAVRRVQRDRRPGTSGDLPKLVRLLHAGAPARFDHVLRRPPRCCSSARS